MIVLQLIAMVMCPHNTQRNIEKQHNRKALAYFIVLCIYSLRGACYIGLVPLSDPSLKVMSKLLR